MAPKVDAHDGVIAGEILGERIPAVPVLGDAVDQHERRAGARDVMSEPDEGR